MKYFIDKFNKQYLEMSKTIQDKEWHAEGDVAIHTEMVLESLMILPEYIALNDDEKLILRYAAFFHDVGKHKTTYTDENGRVRSPGHSKLGSKIIREILYKNNYDFYFREQVSMLVYYHGFPIHFYKYPERDLAAISYSANLKLLYILCKADMLGRKTIEADTQEALFYLEEFKSTAYSLDCFEFPKEFATNACRLKYLQTGMTYVPYEKKRSVVYLMSGLPGSGKDYHVNNILKGIPVISLDNLRRESGAKHGDKKAQGRIIQKAKKMAKEYLAKDINFIWNATNTTKIMREQLISLFKSYGAEVHIIYIENKNYHELLKANSNREHPVKQEVIDKLLKTMDIPHMDEADIVQYILR